MSDSAPSYDDKTPRGAESAAVIGGILLLMVGTFQFLQGVAAVLKDSLFVVTEKYVFQLDITSWGWIHLIIGAIGIAVSIGILMGKTWARLGGIAIASFSALSNFLFLPYYPLWAIVLIALNVLVIWALSVLVSRD